MDSLAWAFICIRFSVLLLGLWLEKKPWGWGRRGDTSITRLRVFNFPESIIKQIPAAAWQPSQTFVESKLQVGDLSEVITRLAQDS